MVGPARGVSCVRTCAAGLGEGRWHAPDGEFAYIDLQIDTIRYNVASRDR
jgi:hypothetical protein